MLRIREAGEGGTPAVFVHGAGASSAVWLGVMHRFARQRRVIAVDLPGHGQSEGSAATIEQHRDAVGATCAHLCLPASILVGHSLGGLVVIDAALAWPDKIAGVVVVMSGARLGVSELIFQALAADNWPRWPARMAEMCYSPATPPDVRQRSVGIACVASREVTEADYRAVRAYDARPRVAEIKCPTLVITGDDDRMTPAKWGEALAAAVPGARHARIAHCGHMPMHERPDQLSAVISEFFSAFPQRTV
jgi:pimeloyl-ACP methyl ester carboxylesterase